MINGVLAMVNAAFCGLNVALYVSTGSAFSLGVAVFNALVGIFCLMLAAAD